jgi:regulatory protein YycI of two-component signal transduction system YycFG
MLEKLKTMTGLGLPANVTITSIEPAYFAPQFDSSVNILKPAWKITFEDGSDERYFDAATGEPLF